MSTVTGIDSEKLKHYAEALSQKKSLEDSLEEMRKEIRTIETELLEQFAETETQKISTGDGTFYVHRQVWSRLKSPEGIEAIRTMQPELVKESVNTQTLSAWVRELTENGLQPLPSDLENVVETNEVFSLRLRKS